MKYIVNVSLLVVWAFSPMVDAFVRQTPSVLISSLRLRGGLRPEDSSYSKSDDVTTTTDNTSVEKIMDALNEEGFLLDMDRSITELEEQQGILLRQENQRTMVMTMEEQLAQQYKPFARLAQQASKLDARYTNEIRDIRSSSSFLRPKTGLTRPTQSLAALGVFLLGATTYAIMTGSSAGIENFVSSIISFTTPDLSSIGLARLLPNLESTSIIPRIDDASMMPTKVETIPDTLRDFSKFDIYGSSKDVAAWFSGH